MCDLNSLMWLASWLADVERCSCIIIAQSEFELEVESTEGDGEKLQEGHNQEAKKVIDSKAQSVADLKKKE
jgi:hypothetical protein